MVALGLRLLELRAQTATVLLLMAKLQYLVTELNCG